MAAYGGNLSVLVTLQETWVRWHIFLRTKNETTGKARQRIIFPAS